MSPLDRLDVLINCADISVPCDAKPQPQHIVDVNLRGTMRVCTVSPAPLQRAKGCVVNIASMLSFFGSASTGGVAQLTRSLAVAWARHQIRVNAIAPGWIRPSLSQPVSSDAAQEKSILQRSPMQQWGSPEDVADVTLFLCSPAARFVTGAIIPVDGGYSAM